MEVARGVFEFSNGNTVDLNVHPVAPAIWATCILDSVCNVLFCHNWRDTLQIAPDSVFGDNHKMPLVNDIYPKLLTFPEFRHPDRPLHQDLYTFAFETPSTELSDPSSWNTIIVLIGLVLILRQIKQLLMPQFQTLAVVVSRQAHGDAWIAANQIRIVKFSEYVFRLFYHSFISILGVYFFLGQSWWTDTVQLFENYPNQEIKPSMAWYYLLQSAYNIDALVSLLELSFCINFKRGFPIQWSKTVRGDFQEMFLHHVVTNVLVVASAYFRLNRIGSMVFLVHDISDVPVDLSKLANFLKWKATTICCFGIMTISWLYTRLYILPFTIYRAVLFSSHHILADGFPVVYYLCYRHLFYVFIGLLIALHFAWFLMFMRMLKTLIVKRECHDYSEHKHGEGKKTL